MELVYYPDPRLKEIAQPVEAVTDELKNIVKEMFEIMYKTDGIGLAGNQVGLMQRVLVANLYADKDKNQGEIVFINPKILSRQGKVVEEEACLSLPGIVAQIQRAKKIKVTYKDLELKEHAIDAEDLFARVLQHEIDHLDGILILDKMTPAEKRRSSQEIKALEEGKRQRSKLSLASTSPRRSGKAGAL